MAANGDQKMKDLNTKLSKILAKSEETVWSGFKDYYYPLLRRELQLCKAIVEANSQVRCQVCGSVAENLEAPGLKNIGDLDVMIFSIAENLIIHEKIIEYFAESPLHVRIKGIQNPTLQSCLVQGTEYVATSTLRNYHSAILPSSVLQALPFGLNIISRFSNFWTVDSSETGAAATLHPCSEFFSGGENHITQIRLENKACHFLERCRHTEAVLGLSREEPTRESPLAMNHLFDSILLELILYLPLDP